MFYALFELRWPGVTCVLKRIRFTDLQRGRALTSKRCALHLTTGRKQASSIRVGFHLKNSEPGLWEARPGSKLGTVVEEGLGEAGINRRLGAILWPDQISNSAPWVVDGRSKSRVRPWRKHQSLKVLLCGLLTLQLLYLCLPSGMNKGKAAFASWFQADFRSFSLTGFYYIFGSLIYSSTIPTVSGLLELYRKSSSTLNTQI